MGDKGDPLRNSYTQPECGGCSLIDRESGFSFLEEAFCPFRDPFRNFSLSQLMNEPTM